MKNSSVSGKLRAILFSWSPSKSAFHCNEHIETLLIIYYLYNKYKIIHHSELFFIYYITILLILKFILILKYFRKEY